MAVLVLFWAYVGQPDGHIGWVTLMPFASTNSTNPRTNPWNFHEKILRIWLSFWIYFFRFLSSFFASSNEKKQPIHMRYHFFVHHEWFLQNLGKEAVWTNIYTTVTCASGQKNIFSLEEMNCEIMIYNDSHCCRTEFFFTF